MWPHTQDTHMGEGGLWSESRVGDRGPMAGVPRSGLEVAVAVVEVHTLRLLPRGRPLLCDSPTGRCTQKDRKEKINIKGWREDEGGMEEMWEWQGRERSATVSRV